MNRGSGSMDRTAPIRGTAPAQPPEKRRTVPEARPYAGKRTCLPPTAHPCGGLPKPVANWHCLGYPVSARTIGGRGGNGTKQQGAVVMGYAACGP